MTAANRGVGHLGSTASKDDVARSVAATLTSSTGGRGLFRVITCLVGQAPKRRRGSDKKGTTLTIQTSAGLACQVLTRMERGYLMGSVIVLPTGAASTTRQGLRQFEGISAESVGSQALCAHLLAIPPGGRAKAHRHPGARNRHLHPGGTGGAVVR
jgi:hypothetical protein